MESDGMNRADPVAASEDVADLEERSWLPRHCRGDGDAFSRFMDAYRTMVFTFLHRYGVHPDQRDDLFQDIFLKLHLAAPSYRPSQPLRPWVVSIVLNSVRNQRRDRGRHLRVVKYDDQVPDMGQEAGTEQTLEDSDTVRFLDQRIRTLPPRQREVLALSAFKSLSMKQIAAVTGDPENTVKTHLRRARLALAEALVARQRGES